MKYRMLGKTGLKVPEIGFGCGNIGGLMVRAPLEERLTAVKRALELGMNYFDTAPAYGNGQSETNLGQVLNQLKPRVIVATKFSLTGQETGDISGAISRSVETSLKRLQRDSVDILQLHTPVTAGDGGSPRGIGVNQVLGRGGVADTLDKIRARGLIRHIGFTGLGDAKALLQIAASRRFDLVQAYFNLLNPSAAFEVPPGFSAQNFEGLIPRAAENGMGVAAIRVMAGGALGGEVSRSGYASPSVGGALTAGGEYQLDMKRAEKLAFLAGGGGTNLSRAAIRFVLSESKVSIAMVGFSDLKQIEEAAASSDSGNLDTGELDRVKNIWETNFTR